MILKCRYYFVNISGTKAPILMKFETYASEVVMDNQNNFRKDSCTNTRTRNVNVRAFRPRVPSKSKYKWKKDT